MRSPDRCSSQDGIMRQPMQGKRIARPLIWVAVVAGGLALAGCSSDAGDNVATPSSGESGSQVDSELTDVLADAQADLTELQGSGILGSGTGVISIEGIDYSFDAEVCYLESEIFEAAGPGRTADGVAYWASLSHNIETRAEMEESGLPEANVDAFFGDRDSIEWFELRLELGKEDQFGSGDDLMADFSIETFGAETNNASYTIEGKTMSGTGLANDWNGVAAEFSELIPATFSVSCN